MSGDVLVSALSNTGTFGGSHSDFSTLNKFRTCSPPGTVPRVSGEGSHECRAVAYYTTPPGGPWICGPCRPYYLL